MTTERYDQTDHQPGAFDLVATVLLSILVGLLLSSGFYLSSRANSIKAWKAVPVFILEATVESEQVTEDGNRVTYYWLEASYLYSVNDGLYSSQRVYPGEYSSHLRQDIERHWRSFNSVNDKVFVNPENDLQSILLKYGGSDWSTVTKYFGGISLFVLVFLCFKVPQFRSIQWIAIMLVGILVGAGSAFVYHSNKLSELSTIEMESGGEAEFQSRVAERRKRQKLEDRFLDRVRGKRRKEILNTLGTPSSSKREGRTETLIYKRFYWDQDRTINLVDGIVKS